MRVCKRCKSDKIISLSAKTSDCFACSYKDITYEGYVPNNIGLGEGGDYIEINYCLECGQIQEEFPIIEELIMEGLKEENCY